MSKIINWKNFTLIKTTSKSQQKSVYKNDIYFYTKFFLSLINKSKYKTYLQAYLGKIVIQTTQKSFDCK